MGRRVVGCKCGDAEGVNVGEGRNGEGSAGRVCVGVMGNDGGACGVEYIIA